MIIFSMVFFIKNILIRIATRRVATGQAAQKSFFMMTAAL
jgi:hypothetical protein